MVEGQTNEGQSYQGKSVAITGGAGGIGRAIAEKFIALGAKVAISDINQQAISAVSEQIGATPFVCDVSQESSMAAFIADAEAANGPIDIFVSNAGVAFADGVNTAAGSDESWEASWQINVMANIYASRHLLPRWVKEGKGRFVVTSSAAGLLTQVGTASYSATKHAALGYAESMAINHYDDGVRVHCICPQYVKTNMTKHMQAVEEGPNAHIEPSDVADCLIKAIEAEEFLVLSHPIVGDYFKGKATDYNRWITGMVRMRRKISEDDMPNLG